VLAKSTEIPSNKIDFFILFVGSQIESTADHSYMSVYILYIYIVYDMTNT